MPDVTVEPGCRTPGPLLHVSDPRGPGLDLYRDLHDGAHRFRVERDRSVFVVEGRLAVERLLSSSYPVRSLLVDDHQLVTSADLVAAVRDRGAPVYVGSRVVVAETVGFAFHRGVVAVADRPVPMDSARLVATAGSGSRPAPALMAVLEGLNDHENLGALFRNAAAFGVAGVLMDPTCADPLYRRSIRVSVGHILHVPFARVEPWPDGLSQVKDAGFVIAALSPRPPDDHRGERAGLAGLRAMVCRGGAPGVAVLLGAEGPGLTRAALGLSDVVVSIPMALGVDSLNVATAAALAFHALTEPAPGEPGEL